MSDFILLKLNNTELLILVTELFLFKGTKVHSIKGFIGFQINSPKFLSL